MGTWHGHISPKCQPCAPFSAHESRVLSCPIDMNWLPSSQKFSRYASCLAHLTRSFALIAFTWDGAAPVSKEISTMCTRLPSPFAIVSECQCFPGKSYISPREASSPSSLHSEKPASQEASFQPNKTETISHLTMEKEI